MTSESIEIRLIKISGNELPSLAYFEHLFQAYSVAYNLVRNFKKDVTLYELVSLQKISYMNHCKTIS